MKSHFKGILFGAALATLSLSARAVTIVEQSAVNGSFVIDYFDPVGQSFTAASNQLVSFEFSFVSWVPAEANNAMTLSIRQGDGLNGSVLASSSLTVNSGGYNGVVFNLNVTAGALYTAVISADSWRWGLAGNTANVYAGGQLYTGGANLGWGETVFRATFADNVSVPEASSTIALLGLALASLAIARRSRAAT